MKEGKNNVIAKRQQDLCPARAIPKLPRCGQGAISVDRRGVPCGLQHAV